MAQTIDVNSLLSGGNAAFLSDLFARYLQDPQAVDPSWRAVFDGLSDDLSTAQAEVAGPSWAPRRNGHDAAESEAPPKKAANGAGPGLSADEVRARAFDSIRALQLIRSYRVRGHLLATLDPLGLTRMDTHPDLEPATYGFTEADYDRPIYVANLIGHETATIREILSLMRDTYCGNIGVEFMHIQELEQRVWIQERIEGARNHTDFTEKGKRTILERLTAAEVLERFLDRKYTGTKRFGIEGAEAMIPALEQIVKRGGQLGIREVLVGMPHRGRLNALANFMSKPFVAIFSEFQGNTANPEDVQGSGDVKYHLGTSSDREFDGISVHLSLAANPSHLEAVNPIVLGKARAKQTQRRDGDRGEVMSLLLHGDAAFAGQGIVAETLALSELRGYRVGGTLHFIVNNQIGFTTMPANARSSPYPTDVAKMVQAPIFHVNGDDPEAVVHVCRIATEFRQRFKQDVVVDMFCYRRHGHNETDEPAFTQPLMYRAIANHPTTRQVYADRLVAEGVVTPEQAEGMVTEFQAHLETQFEAAKGYKPNKADWLEGKWAGLEVASGDERRGETAVSMELLREVGTAISRLPAELRLHRTLKRVLDVRRKQLDTGEGVDWASAEAMAIGTLLVEGTPVRLSGQDSGRGTFSQRHAILYDQETEERYVPLNHLRDEGKGGQANFEVIDSPLSELAVLGFEYGYSLAEPHALVMWEAQFGDFANGAQMVMDQFISSGESKWLRMSGLVQLLPHGYEGNGPEHSSARLERYLQLCAEDNMQVIYPTTPANYFHALRRQVRRSFRKPLIVMTPKSMLRHRLAVSSFAEMGPGTTFHRLFGEIDPIVADDKVRRVLVCSGKVFYDLLEERRKRRIEDVALLRVEQLYPFPKRTMEKELARYPNAEVTWVQEEPRNMGAWTFVEHRIEEALRAVDVASKRPVYIGRPESASTATGSHKRHVAEQARLIDAALAA